MSNGTLYAVVTQSATPPSIAQIQAGQDHTGSAADFATSQAVTVTGTQTVNATGLVASTNYWFHFQHQDLATNDSLVVSADGFTTDAVIPFEGVSIASGEYVWEGQIGVLTAETKIPFEEAATAAGEYQWAGEIGELITGIAFIEEGQAGEYLWEGFPGIVDLAIPFEVEGQTSEYLWEGFPGILQDGDVFVSSAASEYQWAGEIGVLSAGEGGVYECIAGEYQWTGYAGSVEIAVQVNSSASSIYLWEGFLGTIIADDKVPFISASIAAGEYEWTGYVGTVEAAFDVVCQTGEYLWEGHEGILDARRAIEAEAIAGEYQWIGYSGTLENKIVIPFVEESVAAEEYEWSGFAGILENGNILVPGLAGEYQYRGFIGRFINDAFVAVDIPIQFDSEFANLVFGDGIFGTTFLNIDRSWVQICPEDDIWTPLDKTSSVWAEQSINVNEWEIQSPDVVPTTPCRRE